MTRLFQCEAVLAHWHARGGTGLGIDAAVHLSNMPPVRMAGAFVEHCHRCAIVFVRVQRVGDRLTVALLGFRRLSKVSKFARDS